MDDDPSDLTSTGRLLALLSLLEARPDWTGPRLADRLGVTVRTIRRDVDRLRALGYPVIAEAGAAGGYRLGAGGRAMPPLMLDRDEAVAVAVCLRSTATETIAGGGEAAVRALGKLEPLLPPPLRRQVGAIGSMTARLGAPASPVDPDVLITITRACRDSERLRVEYKDARGRETTRSLDPHRLVTTARSWYLVARDGGTGEWRTFRVDRMVSVVATGHRVEIVDPPDPVALVQAGITTGPYRHRARILLDAPLADVAALIPPTVGMLEPIDDATTMLTTGADDVATLAAHLVALDLGFTIVEHDENDELLAYLRRLRERLDRAGLATD